MQLSCKYIISELTIFVSYKENMKKLLLILSLIVVFGYINQAKSQEIGFSFLLPVKGYFSIPVSPLSIRGLGVNLHPNFSISTGFTLYRMSGMSLTDVPFTSEVPVVGPFFNITMPLDATIKINFGSTTYLKISGGGVGFVNFATQINQGALDRAMRDELGYTVLNSNMTYNDKFGWGWNAGAQFVQFVNSKIGIFVSVNYIKCTSKVTLEGTYSAYSESAGYVTGTANYDGAKLNYVGYEVGAGVVIKSK